MPSTVLRAPPAPPGFSDLATAMDSGHYTGCTWARKQKGSNSNKDCTRCKYIVPIISRDKHEPKHILGYISDSVQVTDNYALHLKQISIPIQSLLTRITIKQLQTVESNLFNLFLYWLRINVSSYIKCSKQIYHGQCIHNCPRTKIMLRKSNQSMYQIYEEL